MLAVGQRRADRCWHIQPLGIILVDGGSLFLVLLPEIVSEVQPVPLVGRWEKCCSVVMRHWAMEQPSSLLQLLAAELLFLSVYS